VGAGEVEFGALRSSAIRADRSFTIECADSLPLHHLFCYETDFTICWEAKKSAVRMPRQLRWRVMNSSPHTVDNRARTNEGTKRFSNALKPIFEKSFASFLLAL